MSGTVTSFQFLGTPALSVDGELTELPDTVPARLVAVLALRGTAMSRGELAGILYPEEPEDVARQRIRLQLSRARKLHPDLPLRTSTHYASCIAATDVHDLLREVAEQDWDSASARSAPQLLGTWELQPGLEQELQSLADQLTEAWLLSLRRQAQSLLANNEPQAAFALLSRAIAEDPTAEDALQLLLQVAGPAGRQRAAQAAFRDFREAIAPLEPLPETIGLFDQLLAGEVSLRPDRERVMQAAAVLGEHASVETMAEVINAPVTGVVQVLSELEAEGLLDPDGRLKDPAATLAGLTQVTKRFLHAQAARALRHAELPFAEGEHWLLAGDHERAVAAWFPATTRLFSRELGRQEEALQFYERILALPVRSDAWYAASAYYAMHQLQSDSHEAAMARVDEVLIESTDTVARTFALMVRTQVQLLEGKLSAAAESSRLAELQARGTDSLGLQRDVLHYRITLLARQGQATTALKLANDLIESLRLEPPRYALLNSLGTQASLLCDLGRFEDALTSYREQLQLARLIGYPRDEVRVVADILATLNDMGRAGEEIELGLGALELGEFDVTWPLRFNLAEAFAGLGRDAEALDQLDAIWAGHASVSTQGHALALRLRLAGPVPDTLERALQLAGSTDLVPVRVAIAAALARLGSAVPFEKIVHILADITEDQVPAWQSADWQVLQDLSERQLIRR